MKIIQGAQASHTDFVAEVTTYMGAASIHLFAIGFLEMAEMSAERAAQNECSVDAVIPAMLHTLRHSVELFLKYLVYDLGLVEETEAILGHSVANIFTQYESHLSIALDCEPDSGFDGQEWLRQFKDIVQAVEEIDPDGQSLRYPANKALTANQGGGYALSTQHFARCLATVRSVYENYDQRSC